MTSAGRTVAVRSVSLALVASVVLSPLLLAPPSVAFADSGVCAVPGKDGPGGTLSGIVNTYYPGAGSAAAGATSIPVGAPSGAPTPIAAGDLLLVIQMQDAAFNSSNTDAYGDGVVGGVASGWTDLRNAGRYEYVVAQGPLVAGAVPILGAGAGAGLVYTYTSAAATGSDGQRRFQVIRVPQYSSATLSSGLTALRWNGNVGGVLALDVAGQLTLGGTVDLSGFGFRGGGGRQRAGTAGFLNTDYRTPTASNPNGSKGEGLAGTPQLIYNATTNSVVDTGIEGYDNGSMARGAPGNAGGGGTDGNTASNDQNSGGGGGGNGGQGGLGGNTWSSNLPRGGQGGAAVPAAPARLALGGGGGAGTRNNTPGNPVASSGGAGGGIVMMRAGAISGTGTIAVNGAPGITPDNDGGGGGGGGGSVLVLSQGGGVGNLTLNARGGNGANAWPTQVPGPTYPGNRHGPGGGGAGGVVLLSGAAASIDVSGGMRGTTTTAADPYSAASGAAGVARTNVTPAEVTTGIAGAACLPELTVVKTTSTPGPMVAPNVATYALTVTNAATSGSATGVSLSDPLPSGFTYAANVDPVYAGGATGPATIGNSGTPSVPVFGVPGGNATNSFAIPGGGSVSITFSANIAGSVAPGIYQNPADVEYTDPTRTANGQTITPGAAYASGGGTAGGSNYDPASSTGEDVTIVGPPSISKSFAPDPIAVGATSQLTLTLGNSNAVAATLSADFVDTLPANVIVATPNGLSDTCPGLPSAPVGGSTITYPSGAAIPAGGCTIQVDVTSSTVGTHTNSIAAGDLQTDFGNNLAPASDDLTVTATAPTITKAFNPDTIAPGATSQLTLTLSNSNAVPATLSADFVDTLPANVIVATPNGLSDTCPGVPSAPAGGSSITYPSGATIPAGGCTIQLNVTSSTVGTHTNSIAAGDLQTDFGNNLAPASDDLTVTATAPTVAKAFNPDTIAPGATSQLTLTLGNSNAVPATLSADFVDTLPANVIVATPNGLSDTCPGVPSAPAGGSSITYPSGATIPAGGCTIQVDVTSSTVGTHINTIAAGDLQTNFGNNPAPASDDLTVTAILPPSISKSFAPDPIAVGDSSTLSFTITNPNSSIVLSGVAFTDALPAGLTVASATTSECGGTLTTTAPSTIDLSGGSIPAAGFCSFNVTVTGTTPGLKPNTTGNVASTNGGTGNTAADSLTVTATAPTVAKAFNPDTIAPGAASQLTLTLGNSNAVPATLSADFVDTLPASVIVATPNGLSGTCPGLPSAPAGGSTITYPSGATIPDGGCTIQLNVTSSTVGTHINTIAAGDLQTNFGSNPAPASDDLTVTAATITDPAVTKSGDPATAAIGDTVVFTLVVTNTGPGDADDVVVTDIVPSFLTINSVAVTNPLPPGRVTVAGNTITIDFGTLTPTATCPPASGTSCYVVTIRTTVNSSATPPGGTNSASLTLDPAATDADPDNNADSALTTIVIRSPSEAPETGFAPGRVTLLPDQPSSSAYSQLGDLWLEIPALGIRRTITGVPRQAEGWDVKWLGDLAGYLEGTAFPTWSGNSVITGHVVLATGLPGPFARLDRLGYGDSIVVHAWGEQYRYEVRQVSLLKPTDSSIFRHEDRAWVTLVTCQGYDPKSDTYRERRVVRAVLMEVDGETVSAPPAMERGR